MGRDQSKPEDRLRIDAPRIDADPAFAATLAAWASTSEPAHRPFRSRWAVAAAGLAVAATTLTAAYAVSDLRTPAAPDAPPATHDRGHEPAPPPATVTPDPERVEHGTAERHGRTHRVTPPAVAAQPTAPARGAATAPAPAAPPPRLPPASTAHPHRRPATVAPTDDTDAAAPQPGGLGDEHADRTLDDTSDDTSDGTSGDTSEDAGGDSRGGSDGTSDLQDD